MNSLGIMSEWSTENQGRTKAARKLNAIMKPLLEMEAEIGGPIVESPRTFHIELPIIVVPTLNV